MTMNGLRFSIEDEPSPEDVLTVRSGLIQFNGTHSTIEESRSLTVFLRDGETRVVGGLIAWTWGYWLDIGIVWVDPALQGQGLGSRMLRAAEEEAVRRGCKHAQLDTYSFQAPGFYAKQGYVVFGKLEDMPEGHQRYYLRKRLLA